VKVDMQLYSYVGICLSRNIMKTLGHVWRVHYWSVDLLPLVLRN
jgi:hypothetical protein